MNATMKSFVEYLKDEGHDLQDYMFLDAHYIQKGQTYPKYQRFFLRRTKNPKFKGVTKDVVWVTLWLDHDHYMSFTRANDEWFCMGADEHRSDFKQVFTRLILLGSSGLRPKIMEELKAFHKELRKCETSWDEFRLRLFWEGFTPKLWVNPQVPFKGSLARRLAELYVLCKC